MSSAGDANQVPTLVVPTSPSILKSVTTKSIVAIAESFGWHVEQRPIPFEEVVQGAFDEVMACGTAAVSRINPSRSIPFVPGSGPLQFRGTETWQLEQAITPIRSISYYTSEDKLEKVTIGTGETGPRVLEREFPLFLSQRERVLPSVSVFLSVSLESTVRLKKTLAFAFLFRGVTTVLAELTGIQSGTRQDKNGWCWPREGLDGSV